MKNNIIHTIIFTIILFGVFVVGDVSYQEYISGDACANFTIIPSCYIALIYFILLLIFHLIQKAEIFFFIFSGFALVLSAYASQGHFFENFECAIADIGVPTCYIGFVLFGILTSLKFLEVKINKMK